MKLSWAIRSYRLSLAYLSELNILAAIYYLFKAISRYQDIYFQVYGNIWKYMKLNNIVWIYEAIWGIWENFGEFRCIHNNKVWYIILCDMTTITIIYVLQIWN